MRRYGLDWLRVIVVFLLFPFHTARVFDQWETNYVKDTVNPFSSWFVASLGFWFMALLFVIAGYSTYYALQKRSAKEYTKERIGRLLIPLLFGIVLILPVQGYYAMLQRGTFSGNYFEYLPNFFTNFSDITGYTGGFSPDHLWFILYLFIISMCLLPLLTRIKNKEAKISDKWLLIPAFFVLTIADALPSFGGKNLFYYAALFTYGFLIARSKTAMESIRRLRFVSLAAAIVIWPAYLIFVNALGWPSGYSLLSAVTDLFSNLTIWIIILALMGIADTYLNKPSPALSYMSRASFPIYVLHQSVLIVAAYYIVSLNISPAEKFLAIMFITLAACVAIYEICRRIRPTRFILGIK